MLFKLKLKNSKKPVIVDDFVYEFLSQNDYLKSIKFIENLREHSLGYAFFQKHWRQLDGSYKVETIYLHKLIAEKFVEKPDISDTLYVQFINGNNKDCRVENLDWVIRSKLVRHTKKVQNKLGYRGISKVGKKYSATLYKKNERIYLGRFNTLEEAVEAYNKKSEELFGYTKSLKRVEKKDPSNQSVKE